INSNFSSPIAGRMAWSGNSGGFITTNVTLPPAAIGNFARLRWRATSDTSNAGIGWWVDSILCGEGPPPPPPPPISWTLDVPYPIPIAGQAMTTIGNAIYSFGGLTTDNVTTASAYRFNGSAWTAIAALPVAAAHAAAVSDGQYAYILGGANTSGTVFATAYRYDPGTNTYTTIAPVPTARWNSAAVHLGGKIYKIGGATVTSGGSGTTPVEVYNVASNTWSSATPHPVAAQFVSAFVVNQFVYVVSGSGTTKTFRYDPSSNLWNDAAFADLPEARNAPASASFHSTALLAGSSGTGSLSRSVIQWNAQTNTWATLPEMLLSRSRAGGGILKGCLFVVGGLLGSSTYTTENQKFDCIIYSGFEP
ncbi:MAG: kelch repeat-containing protein, partial [Dokdonella sp.]